MGLNEYVMTYIHHHNSIQSIFTALKILCALPIHLPHPSPLVPLIFLLFPQFSFPKCHIVGIIQYVAFSGCLFSLSNMHLNFSWFDSSFLFSTNIPLSRCTTIYSSSHLLKDILLASKFSTPLGKY